MLPDSCAATLSHISCWSFGTSKQKCLIMFAFFIGPLALFNLLRSCLIVILLNSVTWQLRIGWKMFFQIPNGAKDKDGFQERVVRIKELIGRSGLLQVGGVWVWIEGLLPEAEYPICTFEHIIKTTTSVPNYRTLLRIFFVSFYKTPLLFPSTLINSLPTYPYLFYIFFFNHH